MVHPDSNGINLGVYTSSINIPHILIKKISWPHTKSIQILFYFNLSNIWLNISLQPLGCASNMRLKMWNGYVLPLQPIIMCGLKLKYKELNENSLSEESNLTSK